MAKGDRLRTCCRRAAWVQTPSPALKDNLFAIVYELKKQGRKESTLITIDRKLKYLSRNADLNARALSGAVLQLVQGYLFRTNVSIPRTIWRNMTWQD